jgi:hypothetical protein
MGASQRRMSHLSARTLRRLAKSPYAPIERGPMLRTDVLCRLLVERLNSLGPMPEAAAVDMLEQRQPGCGTDVLRWGRSANLIRRVQHDDEPAMVEAVGAPRSLAA